MKLLNAFITEKLKINKNIKLSPLSRQTIDNWTIDDVEDGDIISYQGIDLFFVYKGLNDGDNKVNNATSDSIVYYWACNLERRKFYEGPDTGIGSKSQNESSRIATIEECEKIFDLLKTKGYKWDIESKKLIKL